MKRYLIEVYKNILNPKIDKNENGYVLDNEKEFEEYKKEESLDKHIITFFWGVDEK